MALPPGVSDRDFSNALREFEEAVGSEWVFTSDEDVALYRDAYSPFKGEEEERVASAAVAPHTVEEVQAVVRTANTYRIPIYPISTGKNLGYGGSAPNLSGSVVLDLKRMNRILEVNERNASALVEPGVSYFDFYRHIQENKLKVWMDCPDPGWGSLIGNALDHGGGYTATTFRNHFDAHCGMEVVLANGELLAYGHGCVARRADLAAIQVRRRPLDRRPVLAVELRRRHENGLLADARAGCVSDGHRDRAEASGSDSARRYPELPREQWRRKRHAAARQPTARWFFCPDRHRASRSHRAQRDDGGARGLRATPRHRLLELHAEVLRSGQSHRGKLGIRPREICGDPRRNFRERRDVPLSAVASEIEDITRNQSLGSRSAILPEFGIPSLTMFSIGARSETNPNPTEGHMWFSPIIPRTGEAIFEANRVFAEAARELDLPINAVGFSLPTTYWNRGFIYLFGFPVSKDIETNRKNRAKFEQLVRIAAQHGWGEYRTPPAYQEVVMSTYSFNNHALRRFHETLKDAVDPNGILSAGRYGIWPKHLRKA